MEPSDIKELVEVLKPQITVPMHYRSEKAGYNVIAPLKSFTDICDDIVYYDGPSLILPTDGGRETAVLRHEDY